MIITIDNMITLSDVNSTIADFIEHEYSLPNPDFAKKIRMGMWLGNTPKEIRLWEKNGSDYILPYGCLDTIMKLRSPRDTIIDNVKKAKKVEFGAVELYPYQAKAVGNVFLETNGILQAPAGSGKTQMGLSLASWIGAKTLWITHTHDLLLQSKERAERYFDPSIIGTITEGKVNIGSGITFATVQTLAKVDLERYKREWDIVIVDECHRVSASASSVTQFQKVLNNLSARWKYGLSATLHRADGLIRCTHALIGQTLYTVPQSEVEEKVMKVGVRAVRSDISLDDTCYNFDGTLNYTKMINYLCFSKERNRIVIDNIEKGKSTLVLGGRVEQLEILYNMLPADMQKEACVIHGKMTTKGEKLLRELSVEQMRTGVKKYLFATFNLAKEGLDIPRLEHLILASPQKDFAVITQSIGRVARTFEGKEQAIVTDIVDSDMFLEKMFKKRISIYRKNGCYSV